MIRVSDAHRRARIAQRHGLAAPYRLANPVDAARAMTGLHATEASTPHLSAWARTDGTTVDDVERALYDERSLLKQMAMRRTLWLVDRELLPAVVGAGGQRVAGVERRRLAKEAAELEAVLGPDWIDVLAGSTLAALADGQRSAAELRAEVPLLDTMFVAGSGRWQTEQPIAPRLLTILAAEGRVVRATNAGHWRISRPRYAAMDAWLGSSFEPPSADDAYAELVRRLLWTFGPVTETDLVWWLGATKSIVRTALAAARATAVELSDGTPAFVADGDTDDLETSADDRPWAALLPTLDPTTMGWKQRDFYLDPRHVPQLFDRNGNGGTTVWVDGRIVGGWRQDDTGRIELVLLEQVGAAAERALAAEVARLDEFVRGEPLVNVFASPLMKAR